MHDFAEAMAVEKFMIDPGTWVEHLDKIPPRGRQIIEQEMAEPSGPTGLALVPDKGYAVLMSGQGPFICWAEWRDSHDIVTFPVSEPSNDPINW